MKLLVDIGNSNITIGVYNTKWKHVWRFDTNKKQNSLFYAIKLNDVLWEAGIKPMDIEFKVL
ncbi:MAG TPA: type III pantothenate kinase, partial [Bacteroidetes bacterium]|nr:type III pantothenate kinase [Bacteroidota bacterium]